MIEANDKQSASAGRKTGFDRLRQDFPVLQREVNDRPLVYLDNAASSQMPRPVIERVNAYHDNEHSNVHRGVHTLSQKATDAYENAREQLRSFINAPEKDQLIYTSGTTEAINMVAWSLAADYLERGDEIIITEMEHHANIVPWQLVRRQLGINIRVASVTDSGEIDIESYRNQFSGRTALAAFPHVSNALGTINPVEKLTEIAHEAEVPVLIDGAQAVPHHGVDVQKIDCEFYAFSGHKMYGPTGVGILYGKRAWLESMTPPKGGGEMIDKVTFEETTFDDLPHKFEAGTPPIAAGIGLGRAVQYLNEIGMDRIERREEELLEYGTRKLNEIEGLRIIGTAPEKASVLSFVFDQIHAHDVGTLLNEQGIAVRTGHHCTQPLMRRFNVPATSRASLAFYNNKEDIDRLVDGLRQVKDIFGA